MIYYKDYDKSLGVCNECGTHMRLPADTRIKFLLDDGNCEKIKVSIGRTDPLTFKDIKKYKDRLKQARKKTKEDDAVVLAEGKIEGIDVVLVVFDFNFMGGSMGINVGSAIVKACEISVKKNLPLIIIPSSGGARMQEGILSLMQMAKTTISHQNHASKNLPFISVLTNPATGQAFASFANLADIILAEPGSIVGFSPVRHLQTESNSLAT